MNAGMVWSVGHYPRVMCSGDGTRGPERTRAGSSLGTPPTAEIEDTVGLP